MRRGIAQGLKAVIVNPANTIDELSMDQIKSIYVGDITDWGDLA